MALPPSVKQRRCDALSPTNLGHVARALRLPNQLRDHLRAAALALFRDGRAITVDLGAVTRADSAALALLVQWLRNAEAQQQTLTFKNVPKNLMSIAGVSSLDDILALA